VIVAGVRVKIQLGRVLATVTEWKMFYLTAGARFHRMPIKYTRLDDPRSGREFPDDPNVDLSGVFVRVGLAFHWFRD
jgi:hypothetical protein